MLDTPKKSFFYKYNLISKIKKIISVEKDETVMFLRAFKLTRVFGQNLQTLPKEAKNICKNWSMKNWGTDQVGVRETFGIKN